MTTGISSMLIDPKPEPYSMSNRAIEREAAKGDVVRVEVFLDRRWAREAAREWLERGKRTARIYHRNIKADGLEITLYTLVVRAVPPRTT